MDVWLPTITLTRDNYFHERSPSSIEGSGGDQLRCLARWKARTTEGHLPSALSALLSFQTNMQVCVKESPEKDCVRESVCVCVCVCVCVYVCVYELCVCLVYTW
ncbi:unnamed protein product [Lota lota]